MRLAQHLKTLLPILLLVFTVSGAVNAKVVSEAQNLTLVGSDIPAGGLVGEDLESAITAGIQVERFNRQLHLKEAIALKGEKDRIETSDLSAAEKKARIDRLEAVSCHFVRCSEGVSEEDAGYEVLAERQALGAQLAKDNDPAYQAIARHYHEGLFVYTDTDRINDFLTRHEEGVARAGQSLTATIGMVGGVAFTVASAPTCPTSGVGCALTVGSVIFTGLEAARFIEGLSDIFGDYELSSGQKVLTSFDDPKKHPDDVNPLGDVLTAAGISVVEVGVGKLLVKTSSGVRAVVDRVGGKKRKGDDVVKSGAKLSDDLAGTFAGGRYTSRVLEKDMILYRAGTADRPLGQFFSKDMPISEIQTRIDKAVLPVWPGGATSPIDTVFKVRIPAGTTIHTGRVGSQGGHFVGGTQQIVVEKPWLIDGVKVLNSSPLK